MYKICVTGSREWDNREIISSTIAECMDSVALSYGDPASVKFLLIQGGAKGADTIAREVAEVMDIPVATVNAEWDKLGKKAGMVRNRKMLDDYEPDILLAFPLANSIGTIGCINEAIKRQILVTIKYDPRSVDPSPSESN